MLENACNSPATSKEVISGGCEVTVPNIFTPNTDGENDFFYIKGLESFTNSKLLVFNRWGDNIYESADYKNDWNGDGHSDGVYYYVLTLNNGTSVQGTVTVLR